MFSGVSKEISGMKWVKELFPHLVKNAYSLFTVYFWRRYCEDSKDSFLFNAVSLSWMCNGSTVFIINLNWLNVKIAII